jgi:hypothetical protein
VVEEDDGMGVVEGGKTRKNSRRVKAIGGKAVTRVCTGWAGKKTREEFGGCREIGYDE